MPPEYSNSALQRSPAPTGSGFPWAGMVAAAGAAVSAVDGAGLAALAGVAITALVMIALRLEGAQSIAWSTASSYFPLGAAVLLHPVGYGGSALSLLALAVAVQLTAASLLAPRRALAAVALTAVIAGTGRASHGLLDGSMSGIIVLLVGIAIIHTVELLSRQPSTTHAPIGGSSHGHTPATPALTGQTRVELEQLREDFNLVLSQLRHEKSSRKSAEEQIVNALRIKEAFLGTMSHELRTPLNQIIGYSEILLEDSGAEPSDATLNDVSRIHRAAMNLYEIVENVLDQSQLELGVSRIITEPVDIAELVDGLANSYVSAASRRNNTLRLRCPDDIGILHTDRSKLHTVLKNLLSNACKFTENGTIRIAVERDTSSPSPKICISVSDTGTGIVPEDMERLFRPFQQADGSTTRRFDGAGLGLAVSRQFCTLMQGDLTAESTPGVGSTFTVRLPQQWIDARDSGVLVKSISV